MKSILIIGLGRFGKHMAKQLELLGHEVMAIDQSEEKVNAIVDIVTNVEIGDSTNEQFLSSLDVENYDVCVVTISNDFQSSLETTYLLKEMGAKMVISRAERDGQAKFLLRNGADQVLYPEKQIAKWAAIRYSADHVFDYIELDDSHGIFEVSVPESWCEKSIGEVNVRKKYGINIIALKREGKLDVSITAETIMTRESTLFVIGKHRALQKQFHIS